jgi:hypothetical protein
MKKYRLYKFYGTAPTWTYNTQGNAFTSATITNGTTQSFAIDFSGVMLGQFQVGNTAGSSVSTTAGLQVAIYNQFTTNNDNVPIEQFVITSVASTTEYQSLTLPTGKYNVILSNLDASHTVTAIATTNTLSWPS